jgi:hypothetical protein
MTPSAMSTGLAGQLVSTGWQWKEPLPPESEPLPPSITATLQLCFTPLELPTEEDPFDVTDGYQVNLVKPP